MSPRKALLGLICLALCSSASAAELAVGSNAPGLDIEKWVKGDAVEIKKGNVYVVEFWATWCGPCIRSMPHLTELQKKYKKKGLTIIGVSSEELGTVQSFGRLNTMGYTVAVDRRDATKRAWFEAAGQKGIPAAFIVDRKGKIAFIGHPASDEFDKVLNEVMGGRYDPVLMKKAAPALKAARQARKLRNWRMADKHYTEIIEVDQAVFLEVALEHLEMMLVDMGETTKGYARAREMIQRYSRSRDVEALCEIAERIAVDPKIAAEQRDLGVAMEAAQAASRLSGNDSAVLSTVALVQYRSGQIEAAVKTQRQAWMSAPRGEKADYKRAYDTYKNAAARTSAKR